MNNLDWYEVTEGPSLLQGDVLRNCPVFAVSDSLSWPLRARADIEVEAKVFDLVVMTQSCDLENEKVQDVLLAQLVAWNDAVRAEVERGSDMVRSRKFRKLLVDGNVPGVSLLHRRDAEPSLPWSVVDFHRCSRCRKRSALDSPLTVAHVFVFVRRIGNTWRRRLPAISCASACRTTRELSNRKVA